VTDAGPPDDPNAVDVPEENRVAAEPDATADDEPLPADHEELRQRIASTAEVLGAFGSEDFEILSEIIRTTLQANIPPANRFLAVLRALDYAPTADGREVDPGALIAILRRLSIAEGAFDSLPTAAQQWVERESRVSGPGLRDADNASSRPDDWRRVILRGAIDSDGDLHARMQLFKFDETRVVLQMSPVSFVNLMFNLASGGATLGAEFFEGIDTENAQGLREMVNEFLNVVDPPVLPGP
jgi:hypothetical protein